MAPKPVVRTDVLPESAWRHSDCDAMVCIDVLLSATTIVTAVAAGRRVFAAPTSAEGLEVKARLGDAMLATDTLEGATGTLAYAGPAWVTANGEARPLVHVSPLASMLAAAVPGTTVYVACLRNLKATAMELVRKHWRVAILAAGEATEPCAEDRMAAAWLAARLRRRGFGFEGRNTATEVARWGRPDVSLVNWSRSAERLRSQGRGDDVDFVLGHVDDLSLVCRYTRGELQANPRSVAPARGALPGAAPALAQGGY
jgi:phosphosulfolactate phosphohydrolase-like enzyme